jgi:hypothetical protein
LTGGGDNQADEYVEIYNVTTTPVQLYDSTHPTNHWRVRGGLSFDFPLITLGPAGSLVLVGFDPMNPALLAAFREKYPPFVGASIFGPFSGNLDNSSDSVQLQWPDVPDADGVPFILVDRVDYTDSSPWPLSPDGSGASLRRIKAAEYGNDPLNWRASVPGSDSPTLSVERSEGNVRLSWPAEPNGWELFSKAEPGSSGVWSPVQSPAVVSNGVKSVTISKDPSQRFYRLLNRLVNHN